MAYAFRSSSIIQACACAALVVIAACGDEDASDLPSSASDTGVNDSGSVDSGADDAGSMDASSMEAGPMDAATADAAPDASAPDCFEDPQTHEEIINACTDSESIDKDPELPLLLPDGGLPPLP